MRLEAVDHVALFVRDVHRSAAWYADVLGLRRHYQEAWGDYPVVMVAGESRTGLALFPARGPEPPAPPSGRVPGMFAHVAFRVGGEALREAMMELRALGVAFEEQDHGIARSVYVKDPDGHQVELTTYDVPPARDPARTGPPENALKLPGLPPG